MICSTYKTFSLTYYLGPEPGGGSPECGCQTIVQESKQVNAEVLVVLHQSVTCRFRDIRGVGAATPLPRQTPMGDPVPGSGQSGQMEGLLTSGSELPVVPLEDMVQIGPLEEPAIGDHCEILQVL